MNWLDEKFTIWSNALLQPTKKVYVSNCGDKESCQRAKFELGNQFRLQVSKLSVAQLSVTKLVENL